MTTTTLPYRSAQISPDRNGKGDFSPQPNVTIGLIAPLLLSLLPARQYSGGSRRNDSPAMSAAVPAVLARRWCGSFSIAMPSFAGQLIRAAYISAVLLSLVVRHQSKAGREMESG